MPWGDYPNLMRSGEAQAARGRKAGPMRHRLATRGGARNAQAEIWDVVEAEYGLVSDGNGLAEVCSPGCKHKSESHCVMMQVCIWCGQSHLVWEQDECRDAYDAWQNHLDNNNVHSWEPYADWDCEDEW